MLADLDWFGLECLGDAAPLRLFLMMITEMWEDNREQPVFPIWYNSHIDKADSNTRETRIFNFLWEGGLHKENVAIKTGKEPR